MRFSIIMPVYNTGEILRTAVDSILQQSFTDFELLLVDDGSKDGSPLICDEYATADKRVRCFHKQNGGICDARNYGIAHSHGEYIGFCDHDDEYQPGYLEAVDKAISEYGADMVKVGFKMVCGNDKENATDKILCDNLEYYEGSTLDENLLRIASLWAFYNIWDGFWKSNLIIDNNVTFDTSYRHGGEDADFNFHIAPYVKKIVLLPKCLYVHYVRLELSTSAKAHDDVWHSFFKQLLEINDLVSKLNLDFTESQRDYYDLCFIQRVVGFFSYAIKLRKSYDECIPYIKTYYDNYLLKDNSGNASKSAKFNSASLNKKEKCGYQLMYFLFMHQHYRLMYLLFVCKIRKF